MIFACLSSHAGALAASIYTFTTLPAAGNISAAPGSTLGWGYSLQNQSSTDWLVPVDLAAGSFGNGVPAVLFDFPIVAPNSSIVQPFAPASGAGLYELTWDPAAPIGFVNSGSFVLSAQWWNGDPLAGGHFLANASTVTASYSAAVSTVPEPSLMLLAGLACCGGLAAWKRLGRFPGRLE